MLQSLNRMEPAQNWVRKDGYSAKNDFTKYLLLRVIQSLIESLDTETI
jgi:hypothetical protein